MDWNTDRVVTALVEPRPEGAEQEGDTDDALIERFCTFFHEYPGPDQNYPYRNEIMQRRDREDYWIELDLEDLRRGGYGALVDEVKKTPTRYLSLLNEAARREATRTLPETEPPVPRFFVTLKPPERSVSIREISDGSVGSLIAVRGLVLQSSRVTSAISDAVIQCRSCRFTKTIHVDPIALLRNGGKFSLPRTCDNSRGAPNSRGFEVNTGGAKPISCGTDPYTLIHAQSTFVDFQTLSLQERHEDLLMGDIPRHIRLVLQRNLVNRLKPGMNVTVYGILQTGLTNSDDASVHYNFLAVVGVRDDSVDNDSFDSSSGPSSSSSSSSSSATLGLPAQISTSQEDKFREFARIPNWIDLVAHSIEPAIYGHDTIKEAIAAMLFGGERAVLSDGMRIRGDINILLLGDPGTAKSQFLKFVNQVAPLSVFTSGKGSSAAGLTASVIREPSSGEWYLEGGAMVLADGGVVCIDEFDKMDEEDRVAIHEAMEQQTISIAKAGITTVLNSRCSVLAAANPVFGSFDDIRTTAENIDFQTTILSRFDLIFLIRDIVDEEHDKQVAEQVISLRSDDAQTLTDRLVPIPLLKQFIKYARRTCHPVLSEAANRVLQDGYVQMRNELAERRQKDLDDGLGSRAAKHIPITVRQLEALIRLSQAFARMCLQNEVTETHATRALQLFRKANDLTVKQAIDSQRARSDRPEGIPGLASLGIYRRVEDEIRMQIPVGISQSFAILAENVASVTGADRATVRRVVEGMVAREELDLQAQGKKVYRRR